MDINQPEFDQFSAGASEERKEPSQGVLARSISAVRSFFGGRDESAANGERSWREK